MPQPAALGGDRAGATGEREQGATDDGVLETLADRDLRRAGHQRQRSTQTPQLPCRRGQGPTQGTQ